MQQDPTITMAESSENNISFVNTEDIVSKLARNMMTCNPRGPVNLQQSPSTSTLDTVNTTSKPSTPEKVTSNNARDDPAVTFTQSTPVAAAGDDASLSATPPLTQQFQIFYEKLKDWESSWFVIEATEATEKNLQHQSTIWFGATHKRNKKFYSQLNRNFSPVLCEIMPQNSGYILDTLMNEVRDVSTIAKSINWEVLEQKLSLLIFLDQQSRNERSVRTLEFMNGDQNADGSGKVSFQPYDDLMQKRCDKFAVLLAQQVFEVLFENNDGDSERLAIHQWKMKNWQGLLFLSLCFRHTRKMENVDKAVVILEDLVEVVSYFAAGPDKTVDDSSSSFENIKAKLSLIEKFMTETLECRNRLSDLRFVEESLADEKFPESSQFNKARELKDENSQANWSHFKDKILSNNSFECLAEKCHKWLPSKDEDSKDNTCPTYCIENFETDFRTAFEKLVDAESATENKYTDLEQRVVTNEAASSLKHRLRKRKFILSFSMGVDSTAHLLILKYLKVDFCCLYIKHSNRDDQDAELQWAKFICAKYEVDLYFYHVKLTRPHNTNATTTVTADSLEPTSVEGPSTDLTSQLKEASKARINTMKKLPGLTRDEYEMYTKMIRFHMYKQCGLMDRVEQKDDDPMDLVIILGHHKDDCDENRLEQLSRGHLLGDLDGMSEILLHDEKLLSTLHHGDNSSVTCQKSHESHGQKSHDARIANLFQWRPFLKRRKQDFLDTLEHYKTVYARDSTPAWSVRGRTRNLLDFMCDERSNPGCLTTAEKNAFLWLLDNYSKKSTELWTQFEKKLHFGGAADAAEDADSAARATEPAPILLGHPVKIALKSANGGSGSMVRVDDEVKTYVVDFDAVKVFIGDHDDAAETLENVDHETAEKNGAEESDASTKKLEDLKSMWNSIKNVWNSHCDAFLETCSKPRTLYSSDQEKSKISELKIPEDASKDLDFILFEKVIFKLLAVMKVEFCRSVDASSSSNTTNFGINRKSIKHLWTNIKSAKQGGGKKSALKNKLKIGDADIQYDYSGGGFTEDLGYLFVDYNSVTNNQPILQQKQVLIFYDTRNRSRDYKAIRSHIVQKVLERQFVRVGEKHKS